MLQLAPNNFEIIIVNDGSVDASHGIIQKAIEGKSYFNYQVHKKNLGIGQSLRTGYSLATKENVCAVPGDCQFNFKELLFCPKFSASEFISFYRRRTHYNLYRSFLNHFNRVVNQVFLGLSMHDVNWIKVYKKSQLDKLDFQLTSSLIESEICAKLFAQNIPCIEIESEYLDRLQDETKGGSLKTVKQAVSDLYKLIMITRKFKRNINEER